MNQDHPALLAEQKRRAALLAHDIDALGALMAPGLVYVHSTGGRDSRESYLESIRSGALRYLAVDFNDLQVHPLPGEVAIVTGRMKAAIVRHGQALDVSSHFMTAWARQEGHPQWRLYAHQGTAAP